jgi:hypothetical protein
MSGTRRRLPNRRRSTTLNLEDAGLRYKITASYFPGSNDLAEVFISNHKAGNAADVAARDCGILISLLLQHGCDARTIARALSRNNDGSASGVAAAALDKIIWSGGGA